MLHFWPAFAFCSIDFRLPRRNPHNRLKKKEKRRMQMIVKQNQFHCSRYFQWVKVMGNERRRPLCFACLRQQNSMQLLVAACLASKNRCDNRRLECPNLSAKLWLSVVDVGEACRSRCYLSKGPENFYKIGKYDFMRYSLKFPFFN